MGCVARTEEPFGTDKEFRIVVAPENAAAILEGLKDARLRAGHCLNHIKAATDVERTARVSQRHRLFRSETVAIRRRVVIDIAAGGLID